MIEIVNEGMDDKGEVKRKGDGGREGRGEWRVTVKVRVRDMV